MLIVAPHADDAEIAAFGLYKEYKDVFILTITAGADGLFKYNEVYKDQLKHNYKKAELRTWNSLTVGKLGGVPTSKALNLGYFIHGLKVMRNKGDKEVVSSEYLKTNDITSFHYLNESPLKDSIIPIANWKSLVANIQMVIRNVSPKNIVAPFPELDRHEDHKISSIALFEALKNEKIYKGNLLLYSNHQLHCGEWFPYGPQGSGISIPPVFKSDNVRIDGLFSFPLDSNLQKDKIFALEATNDLRPDTKWQTWHGTMQMFGKEAIKAVYGYDRTYFRRNVRSNEFFFVKKISSLYKEQPDDTTVYNP